MKRKTNSYISLQKATEYCKYSQEYLSLRARHGKLKAVKLGRNWVTKKEWLEKYLASKKKKPHAAFPKKDLAKRTAQKARWGESVPVSITNIVAKREISPPENLPMASEPFEPLKVKEFSAKETLKIKSSSMICFPKSMPIVCCHFWFVVIIIIVLLVAGGFWQRGSFQTVYQDILLAVQKTDWIGETLVAGGSELFVDISQIIDKLISLSTEKMLFLGRVSSDIFRDTIEIFGAYSKWLLASIRNLIYK